MCDTGKVFMDDIAIMSVFEKCIPSHSHNSFALIVLPGNLILFQHPKTTARVKTLWRQKQDKIAKQQDKGKVIMTMRRNAFLV